MGNASALRSRIANTIQCGGKRPTLPKRLPVLPIPQVAAPAYPVAEEDLRSAVEELRRVVGLLWGTGIGDCRLTGLPVYRASCGDNNLLHVQAAMSWPWLIPLHDMAKTWGTKLNSVSVF